MIFGNPCHEQGLESDIGTPCEETLSAAPCLARRHVAGLSPTLPLGLEGCWAEPTMPL